MNEDGGSLLLSSRGCRRKTRARPRFMQARFRLGQSCPLLEWVLALSLSTQSRLVIPYSGSKSDSSANEEQRRSRTRATSQQRENMAAPQQQPQQRAPPGQITHVLFDMVRVHELVLRYNARPRKIPVDKIKPTTTTTLNSPPPPTCARALLVSPSPPHAPLKPKKKTGRPTPRHRNPLHDSPEESPRASGGRVHL